MTECSDGGTQPKLLSEVGVDYVPLVNALKSGHFEVADQVKILARRQKRTCIGACELLQVQGSLQVLYISNPEMLKWRIVAADKRPYSGDRGRENKAAGICVLCSGAVQASIFSSVLFVCFKWNQIPCHCGLMSNA
jgi:hypothetical protein